MKEKHTCTTIYVQAPGGSFCCIFILTQYHWFDVSYERPHEKIYFLHICKNNGTDQLLENRAADQHLRFLYIDSTIPLLPKSKILSLCLSSVALQPVCVGPGRKPWTDFVLM